MSRWGALPEMLPNLLPELPEMLPILLPGLPEMLPLVRRGHAEWYAEQWRRQARHWGVIGGIGATELVDSSVGIEEVDGDKTALLLLTGILRGNGGVLCGRSEAGVGLGVDGDALEAGDLAVGELGDV